jgi:acetyl esterase/lipase
MVALQGRKTQERNPIRTLGVVACMVAAVALLPACSSGDTPEPAASPSAAAASTDATTTAVCPSGGCDLQEARELIYRDGESGQWPMEVVAPAQEGAWPVVILAHGAGEWTSTLDDWESGIASQGAVTYNVGYPTDPDGERESAESLACALRVAVDDAASRGADTSRVVFVGHSLGAAIGAAVSLGGASASSDCVVGDGDVMPDAFIGWEGIYDLATVDYARGGGPRDPKGDESGDPYAQIGGNPNLVVRLLHGDDEDRASGAREFSQALNEAGYDVETTYVEGGRHDIIREGTPVYQAIVDQVVEVLSTLSPDQ